jgi:hypothetical protein
MRENFAVMRFCAVEHKVAGHSRTCCFPATMWRDGTRGSCHGIQEEGSFSLAVGIVMCGSVLLCAIDISPSCLLHPAFILLVIMDSKRRASASTTDGAVNKRKRTSLTLEMKLEILRRADAGERSSALGHAFNLGESTIRNIKKNADKNSYCCRSFYAAVCQDNHED